MQIALVESEEFSTSLLTNSPIPIIVLNPDSSIRYVNPSLEKLTGFSHKEVIGLKPPYPWWSKGDLEGIMSDFEKHIRGEVEKPELLFTKKNGEQFWVEITTASVLKDGKLKYYLRNWVDVTERKRLTENLRFYTSELTRAEEAERKRIARELHDDTAQSLSSVSLEIDDLLRNEQSLPGKSADRLKYIRAKIRATIESIRRLSYNLRPGVLDHLGLIPALEQLTEEMSKDSNISAHLEISDSERRLLPDTELVLFRIAQEALNNARKYSQATEVIVSIEYGQGKVSLKIADNGIGFELPDGMGDFLSRHKLGLVGMHERTRSLGGTWCIKSQPGKGTTVTAEIPLKD